jgi:uncharacterized protein with PQ loop repeat
MVDMIDSVGAFALPSYPVDAAPVWVDALAVAAGSVGVASQWPQVWRLWRTGRYAGLSTLSCILNVLTPATWLAYGLSQLSGVQIIMNSLALLGSIGVILGLAVRASLRLRAWLPTLLAGLTAIAAMAVVGGPLVAGAVASAVTLAMALPQVWLLLRGRITGVLDASGVSRTRWGMSALCNVGWVSYGVLVTDPAIGFTATTMVLSSVAVLVLCAGTAAAPLLRAVPDLPADSLALPASAPGPVPAGGALPSERVACSP